MFPKIMNTIVISHIDYTAGDITARIEQEIILGMGGVLALAELGITPSVWHINEGHAAFLILQRVRAQMQNGLDFHTALESVAVNTVFTTHTPVPAGHDHFSLEMMQHYFSTYCEGIKISFNQLMGLGLTTDANDFNMTALAIRGSRHQNGVSRIHGDVSAHICQTMWPEIEPQENPLAYITNGVHVPTFLAYEWGELF